MLPNSHTAFSIIHIQHDDKRHTCEQTIVLAEHCPCCERLGSQPVAQRRASHGGLIESDTEWADCDVSAYWVYFTADMAASECFSNTVPF